MMVASLGAAQAAEIALRPIRRDAIDCVGLVVIDPIDLETGMQFVPVCAISTAKECPSGQSGCYVNGTIPLTFGAMAITQPFYRTCRQFTDGQYADGGKAHYIQDKAFAKDGAHYVRVLILTQKDLLELFEFIEPDDKNNDTYSYRTHALLMRTAIELEANCRAILVENGFPKSGRWTMGHYKQLEQTHRLSEYELVLPMWNWPPATRMRKRFEKWATGGALPWWVAYNEAKHDRHEKFAKATISNLVDAVCALVAILSAQFHTHDFSPETRLPCN